MKACWTFLFCVWKNELVGHFIILKMEDTKNATCFIKNATFYFIKNSTCYVF